MLLFIPKFRLLRLEIVDVLVGECLTEANYLYKQN